MSSVNGKFVNECNISMKWILKKEEFASPKLWYFQSLPYATKIPGIKYYLRMYPNGKFGNAQEVRLHFILIMEFKTIINVDVKMFVHSASKKIEKIYMLNKFCEYESCEWGKMLCMRDELLNSEQNYFVNDKLSVDLQATFTVSEMKIESPIVGGSSTLSQLLWEMDNKDISIFVKEHEFKIHKLVLIARSSVFQAMFNSGAKEAIENKIIIIDFPAETIKLAIDYCYDKDVKSLITALNACDLLHFADKYDIKDLKFIVEKYFIENLYEMNVCEFANMSFTSDARELREFCICFLSKFSNSQTHLSGIRTLNPLILEEVARRSFNPVDEMED